MTLPRESHSRDIRSKNKSVYENAVQYNTVELHAPTHRLLVLLVYVKNKKIIGRELELSTHIEIMLANVSLS